MLISTSGSEHDRDVRIRRLPVPGRDDQHLAAVGVAVLMITGLHL
jgi:hypothetical protein